MNESFSDYTLKEADEDVVKLQRLIKSE